MGQFRPTGQRKLSVGDIVYGLRNNTLGDTQAPRINQFPACPEGEEEKREGGARRLEALLQTPPTGIATGRNTCRRLKEKGRHYTAWIWDNYVEGVKYPSPPSPLSISHVQLLNDDISHSVSLVIYPQITAKTTISLGSKRPPANNFYLLSNTVM